MDVVSEAVGSVRIGRADACWITRTGAWGMRYPVLPVSGFHVLMRGTAWLISAEEAPRELTPGDVVFTAAGGSHGLSPVPARLESLPAAVLGDGDPPTADADVVFLCGAYWLTHGRAHPYLRTLPEVLVIRPDDVHEPELRVLIGLLDAEVSGAAPGAAVSRPALLDLLLTQMLRGWLARQPATVDAPADPVIADVTRQIRDRPGEPWTVQLLSDRAGLPRREFSRRFAEVTGRAPRAYLTEARLAFGARLLRESDVPLAAIARRTGYSTEFAFSGAFRREYGISPGRFRRAAAL